MRFLLATILIVVAANAQAASFDCAKARTDIEHMICGDTELSSLDETLGRTYSRALKRLEDPDALRAAQRAWLRDVRNTCGEATCLRTAYRERLEVIAHTGLMTNERANELRDMVVGMINTSSEEGQFLKFEERASREQGQAWKTSPSYDGTYLDRVLEVDHDGDGEFEMLARTHGGGTCSTVAVVDLAAKLVDVYPSDEEIRWSHWGLAENLFFMDGEPLTLTWRAQYGGNARLVSWLAPDGTKRALCLLEATSKLNTQVVDDHDPALCTAASNMSLTVYPWHQPKIASPEHFRDNGQRTDDVFEISIDIDLDGEIEALGLLEYASGAVCGSYSEWIVEIDRATGLPDTTNDTLRFGGPISNRETPYFWEKLRIVEFRDKPYVLSSHGYSGASISSVWNGQRKTWCTFDLRRQHEVMRYYGIVTLPDAAPADAN
jgi:uncharacterized protein YecT (DUF1311 family)